MVLALAAWIGYAYYQRTDAPRRQAPPPALATNGLTSQERDIWSHLAQGTEFFPLNFALALHDVSGVPFMDNLERYGLIPDPKGPGNPFGLPVGVSLAPSKISGIEMIGLNCNACHTQNGTTTEMGGPKAPGRITAP